MSATALQSCQRGAGVDSLSCFQVTSCLGSKCQSVGEQTDSRPSEDLGWTHTYPCSPACPPCLAPGSPQTASRPGPGQRCGYVLRGTNTKRFTELVWDFCCCDVLSLLLSIPVSLLSSFTEVWIWGEDWFLELIQKLKEKTISFFQLLRHVKQRRFQVFRHAAKNEETGAEAS